MTTERFEVQRTIAADPSTIFGSCATRTGT